MHDHLLDSRTVACFVADGFVRFDALVDDQMNRAVLDEMRREDVDWLRYNNERLALADFCADTPAYDEVLRLPAVQGIIRSLVGAGPRVDHRAMHTVPPRHEQGQIWHADATIDTRTEAFDIQLFYFPHDTPREAGGTMFLPGSHFRRVHEATIGRYHNFRGQQPTVCAAGTVIVAHQNLWHCGQPNRTDATRMMIKLRLNPTVRQRRLFDLGDAAHPDIADILATNQPWLGADYRLEILQRLRLWRSLTDSDFDCDLWLSRLEQPGCGLDRRERVIGREFAHAG